MLERPKRSHDFARYTYRSLNEVTMGYEYELYNEVGYGDDSYSNTHIEYKRKAVSDILAALPNHFRAEYEGFGNGAGVEIKSVVAPLFLHKQFWNRYVSKIPLYEGRNNNRDNDSGIHVSISKTSFTEPSKDKVFAFLHKLANRPTFYKLSKRTQHNFDQYSPSHPNGNETYDYRDGRWGYFSRTPVCWNDHYNIINEENTNRYEFRMFAAHPTLLLPALEMCDSLFKMAPDYEAITIPNWRDYISCFKKYEHIKEHCIATLDRTPS